MILIVFALLAVATVPLTGATLRPMSTLPIRHLWMVWLAIGLQTLLVSSPWHPPEPLAEGLHLGSYGIAGAFALIHWRVPGVKLIGLGGLLNLIAIVSNGGVMPASATALRVSGINAGNEFSNSTFVDDARVQWLGDIFAVPASWPLSNVFSIGDIVVVVGIGYLAHRQCRSPHAPERCETPDPDHTFAS